MRLFQLLTVCLTSVVSIVTATLYQSAQVVPVATSYPVTGAGGYGFGGYMPMGGGMGSGSGFGGIFSLLISLFFLMFLMNLLFGINRGSGSGSGSGSSKHVDYSGPDPWATDPWAGGPGGAY